MDVEGGQSLPEEQRIAFWSDINVPRNIKERLSAALTDVYINLDNLSKFVELNYDGFRWAVSNKLCWNALLRMD